MTSLHIVVRNSNDSKRGSTPPYIHRDLHDWYFKSVRVSVRKDLLLDDKRVEGGHFILP